MSLNRQGNADNPFGGIEWWLKWTPELAYVLGFIFADGSVRPKRNDVSIAQKDRAILETLLPIMQGENKQIFFRTGVWVLRMRLFGLRRILACYGIVPNKTQYGRPPGRIPPDMVPHYIRGFFDGDGHIIERKSGKSKKAWVVGFTCHIDTYLSWIVDELAERGMKKSSLYKSGNNWKVRWGAMPDVITMHNILYDNATLFLPRKKVIFEEAINFSLISPYNQREYLGNLDRQKIREIRKKYATGNYSYAQLSREYSIADTSIKRIVMRKQYGHIT